MASLEAAGYCKSVASSLALPTSQRPVSRSRFLGRNNLLHPPHKAAFTTKQTANLRQRPQAKFDLFEILGGRGLCNGEKGIEKELERNLDDQELSTGDDKQETSEAAEQVSGITIPDDAFEKELLGLTGGFPGGETGLNKFIEENPPPKKGSTTGKMVAIPNSRPKPPELPLLLPGMVAIVKNPNSPYYMYCGIVQRITDGKAGVLFEGGNWDRLITFRLEELERREKGPPMKNPKSVVIETLVEEDST